LNRKVGFKTALLHVAELGAGSCQFSKKKLTKEYDPSLFCKSKVFSQYFENRLMDCGLESLIGSRMPQPVFVKRMADQLLKQSSQLLEFVLERSANEQGIKLLSILCKHSDAFAGEVRQHCGDKLVGLIADYLTRAAFCKLIG